MVSPAVNVGGLLAALAYGACSTSMAFINKAMLNTMGFNHPFFIMMSQMLFTILLLEGLRLGGVVNIPSYSLPRGWSFVLPSLFYAINSIMSLTALSGMNIPMYGVIKRCSPLAILVLGTIILKKGWPSKQLSAAIVALTLGCIIAGYGDLAFDLLAYSYGMASVFSQACYLILVQKHSQYTAEKLSATETLHLNSYNTLPMLSLASMFLGEFSQSARTLYSGSVTLWTMFFLVISTGCLLNYLMFLCTTKNSALTTSVVGCIKSILQTAIGMFTFGGISLNVFTISGILTNLMGGVFYSYAKFQEGKNKEAGDMKRARSGTKILDVENVKPSMDNKT